MGREEDERRALLQGEPKGSANPPPTLKMQGAYSPRAAPEGGREGSAEQFFL